MLREAVTGWLNSVSTHSRLKAAGKFPAYLFQCRAVSTHSRLKAAGPLYGGVGLLRNAFQHTAA